MPLNDTILNVGNATIQTTITHLSLHTATPDATGSNPALCSRQATATHWVTAANGDIIMTDDIAFTGGAASGACTHLGFWSSAGTGNPPTGGTFYGYLPLTGDQTFNASGEYTLTAITITGTAT